MDLTDIPDPKAAAIEAAKAILLTLPERALDDDSVVFAEDMLEAMRSLRRASMAEYILFEKRLRGIKGFSVQDLRAALKTPAGAQPATFTAVESNDWRKRLTYANGHPEGTESNVISALGHCPQWKGVLAFDEFANTVILRKPAPWFRDDAPHGGAKSGEWIDDDDVRLACWLQREIGLRIAVGSIPSCVLVAARRNTIHPVREYFDSLAWDGVPRLETWLRVYAGATKQPPEYVDRVGGWWLVSAVARIYQPGCQADHCVILEGEQGAGKSTLAKRLVPKAEWFAVHNANLVDKDSYAILQGRLILELAELDSLARQEVGRIKRYMTESTDTYRPVWARRVARFARQCVFIGTCNDAEYLRDPTGNRRMWPVAVGIIENDMLDRDRDQLWAEAVSVYKRGGQWWPRPEDKELLTVEQEQRVKGDAWEDPIEIWLAQFAAENAMHKRETFCTTGQILSGAIHKAIADHCPTDADRVGRIVARLGWHKKQTRRHPDRPHVRTWVYCPPDPPPDPPPVPEGG